MTGAMDVDSPMEGIKSENLPADEPIGLQYPTPQYSVQGLVRRNLYRDMPDYVKILVGPKKVNFFAPSRLLTAYSPFFAAALNGRFLEAIERVVRLPEEKPETFEWFLQWVTTGTLMTAIGESCNEDGYTGHNGRKSSLQDLNNPLITKPYKPELHDGDLRNHAGSPKYFLLIDLYGMSDRLLTTALSNHIIDTIARLSETTNSVPTPSDTWILYGDCASSNGLHHCQCRVNLATVQEPPIEERSGPRTRSSRARLDSMSPTRNDKTIEIDTTHSKPPKTPRRATPCPSLNNPVDPDSPQHPEGIRPTAPLRDLILDLFTYKKTDRLLATHKDDWHPLFLRELVVRLKRPGRESLSRHTFSSFTPRRWTDAKACEACRAVVGPNDVEDEDDGAVGGMQHNQQLNVLMQNRQLAATAQNVHRTRAGLPDVTVSNAGRTTSRRTRRVQENLHAHGDISVPFEGIPRGPVSCIICNKVYCASCLHVAFTGGLDNGDAKFGLVGGDVGPCKPWLQWEVQGDVGVPNGPGLGEREGKRYALGVCGRYHEHGWMSCGPGGGALAME